MATSKKCGCCKNSFSCSIKYQGSNNYLVSTSACPFNMSKVNWAIKQRGSRKVFKSGISDYGNSKSFIINLSGIENGKYILMLSSTDCVGNASCDFTISDSVTTAPEQPQNGFNITGIGQVVTGAFPKQSYHTVVSPIRVINIDTTPKGTYSGTVTINNITMPIENLDTSQIGFPAIYFNPLDSVWQITQPNNYQISITLNILGQDYTKTTSTLISSEDLNQSGGSTTNPPEVSVSNPDIECVIDINSIIGRFKFEAFSSGDNISINVKSGNTLVSTNNFVYSTYAQITFPRYFAQQDLSGQTLTFEFLSQGKETQVKSYFIPKVILREYTPKMQFSGNTVSFPEIDDQILILKITKPFNSNNFIVEDVGSNLGMSPFYYKNGTISKQNGIFNASVLSTRPIKPETQYQIVKYLIDSNFPNINSDTNLFSTTPYWNKNAAKADFWIKSFNPSQQ